MKFQESNFQANIYIYIYEQEFFLWRRHWMERWDVLSDVEKTQTCASTIKSCSRSQWPKIVTLLQILCTIPATSCECERSASVMRRLHTNNRASIGQQRLSSLALIHINYETPLSMDDIVDTFAAMKPHRMQLKNMLCDWINLYGHDVEIYVDVSLHNVKLLLFMGGPDFFQNDGCLT